MTDSDKLTQAHETKKKDAHPATVRPLCPGGLRVSWPHRPFSRCLLGIWTWQMRLFACQRLTHRSPFRTRLRWPSLWCWTTASAIFCVASALQCGWPSWMTSGLHPAVPHLSALASRFTLHQFAVQHLLCPLFVFRLLSPVTDSDKLIKAHETKKTPCAVCGVDSTCQCSVKIQAYPSMQDRSSSNLHSAAQWTVEVTQSCICRKGGNKAADQQELNESESPNQAVMTPFGV